MTHNTREFQRLEGLQLDDWETSYRISFLTDRDGHMNRWSMDLDGRALQQHTFHDSWDAATPSLSEGSIAYKLDADLWLYDLRSGTMRLYKVPVPPGNYQALATDGARTRRFSDKMPSLIPRSSIC